MPSRSKPGLVRHVTGTMGWSRRFWPTPGNRGLRGCPSSEGVPPVRRPKASGVGGSDCAAAENDLVALDGELLAAALHHRAYGLVAFEDDPVDGAVGPDRQVEPVTWPGPGSPGRCSSGCRWGCCRTWGRLPRRPGCYGPGCRGNRTPYRRYKKRAGRGASLPV